MYDKQNTGLGRVLLLLSFILSVEESLKKGNVGQCKMKEEKINGSVPHVQRRGSDVITFSFVFCHNILYILIPSENSEFLSSWWKRSLSIEDQIDWVKQK